MAQALFLRRKDDGRALEIIEKVLTEQYPDEDIAGLMKKLRRRPMVRWFVLRQLREEVAAAQEGDNAQAIDWENLGDFIVKIAPIILEILMMFL